MELKQLEYFIHLAETGSVSQSAKQLELSQPSLSRHIQQLEQSLGVALFNREHRPMTLTVAGEFFVNQLKQPLLELQQAVVLTQQFSKKQQQKSLTIGFVASILYGLLPEIISQLRQNLGEEQADLDIKLLEISAEQQIHALKSGEIDLCFGRSYHHATMVRQIFLRNEPLVVALPYRHAFVRHRVVYQQQGIHLSHLVNEQLILYHKSTQPKPQFQHIDPLLQLFEQQQLQVKTTLRVRDIQIALGLVAAGEGFTLVPESLKAVRQDQVCYLPLLHYDMASPIFLNVLSQTMHPLLPAVLSAIYAVYDRHQINYQPINLNF